MSKVNLATIKECISMKCVPSRTNQIINQSKTNRCCPKQQIKQKSKREVGGGGGGGEKIRESERERERERGHK